MPLPEAVVSLELEIVRMKAELERLTRSRNLALREGKRDEGERHHLSALEAEVRHVEALARYVKTVSPAAAGNSRRARPPRPCTSGGCGRRATCAS